MFTDVVGFTGLAQTDEAGALRQLRVQAELVHAALVPHRGREVKSMGDGLLLEFPSALDAVQCAVDLQRSLHDREARAGTFPLRVRIGIHVGDVVGSGTDILGDAVNIASRVEGIAEPGGICLSAQAHDQVRSKVPYRFEALGPTDLKGLHAPLELYRVVLPWAAPEAAGISSASPRLAVLPLSNISPDPNDAYLADGLTEELISVLSRLRGVRVIARTSVSQYKGTAKPVRQIGTELGVGAVLEGSVRRAGDRLRITLQLIDAPTEEHRWAETYDRQLSDVFAIQAEVAERTAAALRVELAGADRAAIRHGPTENLQAYESYLKGMAAFQRTADAGWDRAGTDEAARAFEEAIALDPAFAQAHASYANLLIAAMGENIPRTEVEPRVRPLVEKALQLDPRSADAHTARGNFALQIELDWARAEKEFRQAIELNPSCMPAHAWYGILHYVLGRSEEALREIRAAADLDPLFRQLTYWQSTALLDLGDVERAGKLVLGALEQDPAYAPMRFRLARVYLASGRTDDARRELALSDRGQVSPAAVAARAVLRARMGEPDEARRLLARAESPDGTLFLRPTLVAELLVALGRTDEALALLENDCRDGERSLWIDYRWESYDPIREDPRFLALLRSMQLPTELPGRLARAPRARPGGDSAAAPR